MMKEVKSHSDNVNWVVMNRDNVPMGHKVLPAIWAMRRKRDIVTCAVYKWKAPLNIHGGKQVKGLNYWDTYAPVALRAAIRMMLATATLKGWATKQMDFVLAFLQALVETDLYMVIPTGFRMQNGDKGKFLKLRNNLYSQKQAGGVWDLFLTNGLIKMGFVQSLNDPCVFWRNSVIAVIYIDNAIITSPNESLVNETIKEIGNNFDITHKDLVDIFLGVKIVCYKALEIISFMQPHLIQSILEDLDSTESQIKGRYYTVAKSYAMIQGESRAQ
jgi:Reverse transcriptase (RNA-dependent DNA polymerase)